MFLLLICCSSAEVGLLASSLMMVVVESAVVTTFVCFAEDAHELSRYTRRTVEMTNIQRAAEHVPEYQSYATVQP